MKPDPGSSLVSEVNLKWIKGLNVGTETMKTLQENMEKTLGHWNGQDDDDDDLDKIPKYRK